ncbi:glutathione peroxidase [Novosphingobium sp. YJ-S2-02]|uniref:Glutathione peroxidase n=1 Tax=Novosphingobium aureum TaxID=2792964 RepID=A0A931H9J2_9SPHN|nr:glutathione peroxidase [Novosphingobium aureum]MBH0111679.1 glutathione peroxidase [Novosphingobium aureum]
MTDIASIPLTRINGSADTLAAHSGKVLLIVNTASKCGLTPQYEGLEALFQEYKDKGLEILGFPANDFGAQEPGTNEEITEFCQVNYGVSFPLFAKADVTGEGKQPLYAALTQAKPEKVGPAEEFREKLKGFGMTPTQDPEVLWNFEKFLVSKEGEVVGRFAPGVEPKSDELVSAIEAELAK